MHEAYIRKMAERYAADGYSDIKADHIACANGKPERVVSFVPDVSAVMSGETTICEVETADTIQDEHTVAEWRLYDQCGCAFHVALPGESLPEALKLAKRNGITVDKFWEMD